jgi:hypothetical protein
MIQTLDDAWEWYKAVDRLCRQMQRMATKYWDRDELSDLLAHDNTFRDRTAAAIQDDARRVFNDLEDLAVLVLFTVFEAEVREIAQLDAERLLQEMTHPAMQSAAKELQEAVEKGSFSKLTAAYKPMDVDGTAQIDQIRGFRNWVAHGRRGPLENSIDPEKAIARMRLYVEKVIVLVESHNETDAGAAE